MTRKQALALKPGDKILVRATVGHHGDRGGGTSVEGKRIWIDCQFPSYALNIEMKHILRGRRHGSKKESQEKQ